MTRPVPDIAISIGGLIDFVGARPTQRINVVRTIAGMYLADYAPEQDYYKQVREGISEGLLLGNEEERLGLVLAEANEKKRENYQAIADGWLSWRRGKNLELVLNPKRWAEQQLTVKMSPMFAWRQRRGQDLVLLYLKEPELAADAAQAATRVLELTFGNDFARAAVLDVRRGALHRARRRRPRDYDAFLTSEVSALLSMLSSIQGSGVI